jgi:hypothetical protein
MKQTFSKLSASLSHSYTQMRGETLWLHISSECYRMRSRNVAAVTPIKLIEILTKWLRESILVLVRYLDG